MYSPWLGRFLSMDPIGFDAGDYNLYRYVFNNPVNATDPTGEIPAFIAWLAKAAAEAAVDALIQATYYYFFDPTVTTAREAIDKIDLWQVGRAGLIGLLPIGNVGKTLLEGAAFVVTRALEAMSSECKEYSIEQALFDFGYYVITDLMLQKGFEAAVKLVKKYGKAAVEKGLKKLGGNDAVRWLNHKLAEHWVNPIRKRIASKFPASWGGGKPNRNGIGWRWLDPDNPSGNGVRIDMGDPSHPHPTQQVDHVVVRYNGQVIGRDGLPISGAIRDDPINAHIPLSEYETWTTWYSP